MRNLLKRITPVILALALALSVSTLFACKKDDGDTPPETVYTVIVKNVDGSALDGANGWDGYETVSVKVQFCQVDSEHNVGVCYSPKTLGSDGKITFDPSELAGTDYEGEYKIAVNNLPEGLTMDNVYIDATPQTIIITLKAVA
jgi:hypothetical protein